MTTITKIVFPTTDDTMGDTSPENCNAYRAWFAEQLRAEYPSANITVTRTPGRITVETDDESDDQEIIQSLHEFGNHCWDRCPWDFISA